MNNELTKRILSSFILIPLVFFFIIKGSFFFNVFILLSLLITLYEWHYLSLKKAYYLPGLIFIFLSFFTFYLLRNESLLFFLLILLTCIATDIGGYLFGKILKGPKISKISPNKTFAGFYGGLILSLIIVFIYFNNLTFLSLADTNEEVGVQIIAIVLAISFVSQIGDFTISFFKRKSKIKNTGNIIPGHGGLLDRIDGMIFAFPFAYILTKII